MAIAASTWFHTSVCSPVVHGTEPHPSCIAAMDAAVSATCAALRMPSRYGSRAVGSVIGGLAEVQHHALADQRVEHPAGQPERLGLLHDLPDQQFVVRLRERVVV